MLEPPVSKGVAALLLSKMTAKPQIQNRYDAPYFKIENAAPRKLQKIKN